MFTETNEVTEMQEQEPAVSPVPEEETAPAAGAQPADAPADQEPGEEHADWKTQENAENAQRRRMAEAARQQQYEAVFAEDLAAIKQLYPDEKAKDIRDLGDEFMAMMASGQVDAVSAYEAIRARKNRTNPKPPSTGGLGSNGGKKPAYFTKEQVDAMSDAEIDKNYDAIRKSMMRW